jgi:hypothetical protein
MQIVNKLQQLRTTDEPSKNKQQFKTGARDRLVQPPSDKDLSGKDKDL